MEPNRDTPPTPSPENNPATPAQPTLPNQQNSVNPVMPQQPSVIPPSGTAVAPQTTTPPQPIPPTTEPVGQPPQQLFASDPSPFKTPSSGKKKFIIITIILAVILLIAGGLFFFLYFWPNQPKNVWNSGLSRSGQAIDKLVANATQEETINAFKKSNISITLDANSGEANYSGKFETKFDESKADGSLILTAKDNRNTNINLAAKFMSEFKDETRFPEVYFQVTGLKSFGADLYLPGLSAYDGKWISIDESYWKTLGISAEELNKKQDQQVTSEDIASTARTMTATVNEYVFTTKPDKAIFEQRKFIGKEKVDDINTYRYQVGINKNNTKKFCEAIVNAAVETAVYKKVTEGETISSDDKSKTIKECQDSVDKDIKDSETFDLWIDTKYKLVYKVRLPEDGKPDTYLDIGQRYKGDNQVSFFSNYHNGESKTDAAFNVQTDMQSHKTTGSLEFKGTGQSPYDAKLTITAEPYNGDITVTKPAGAVPIQELMKTLETSSSRR